MPSNKPRIGIIGIGFGTAVQGPRFQSEAWDVVALCSRNRKKLRKAADAAGVADIHTDALEIISRDDLDAIAITTPPSAHCTLLQAASCVSTMPLVVVIDPRLLIKSMAGLINYPKASWQAFLRLYRRRQLTAVGHAPDRMLGIR